MMEIHHHNLWKAPEIYNIIYIYLSIYISQINSVACNPRERKTNHYLLGRLHLLSTAVWYDTNELSRCEGRCPQDVSVHAQCLPDRRAKPPYNLLERVTVPHPDQLPDVQLKPLVHLPCISIPLCSKVRGKSVNNMTTKSQTPNESGAATRRK